MKKNKLMKKLIGSGMPLQDDLFVPDSPQGFALI